MAWCWSAAVRERPAARHAAAPKSISAVMRDHGTLTWVSIMIPLAGLVVVADDAFNWPPIFDSGARGVPLSLPFGELGSEARSRRGDDDHPPAGTVAGQDGAGDPPKNRALTPVSHDRAAGVSLADFRSARSRDHEAGGGDQQAIQSHRLQHADALPRDSRSSEPENRRRQSATYRDWLAAAHRRREPQDGRVDRQFQ